MFSSQTRAHVHGEGSYHKHRFAFRIPPLIYLLALTAGHWGLISKQRCSVLFATQLDGGEVRGGGGGERFPTLCCDSLDILVIGTLWSFSSVSVG